MLNKHRILSELNSFLVNFGFKLERRSNFLVDTELPYLTSHADFVKFYSGFYQINNIYDIGSHKGWWTREVQFLLPKANFFLFDPVKHEMMGINMERVRIINQLLSNKVGVTQFYSKGETGDSYRKELLKNYEPDEVKDVITTTLNELFASEKLPYPDLIKLDTQGSELDILEGGLGILAKCKFIVCELPLFSYNFGAPSFDQYLEKLDSLGFFPAHILEAHVFEGKIIQIDFAFINAKLI